MNKIYVSSLLIALIMAGTQSIRAQESELDALMAEMEASGQTGMGQGAAGAGQSEKSTVSGTSLQDLYGRGVEAYRAGDYSLAITIFEAMLAEDPYDTRATKYLRLAADKSASKASRRIEAIRDKSMADVERAWTPDFSGALTAVSQPVEKSKTGDEKAVEAMIGRLKGTMIPTLDFRDANIKDVILFLSETCRRLDEPAHDGINFILLGLEQSDKTGATVGNDITISIRDMSLFDSLQAIVEMANLRLEVQPESVTVMPQNYVRSVDLVQKSFEVISEVGDELAAMAGGGDSGGGMDDLFGESTAVAEASGPVDVAGYFSYVQWPNRSSAVYYPAFHKLIVKNSADNLDKIKKIIDTLTDKKISERSNQVQIEAKFVEFGEGAYDELGFNWNVYGTGSLPGGLEMLPNSTYTPVTTYATGTSSAHTDIAAGYYTRVDPDASGRPGEALFNAGQRSGSQVYEATTSAILSSMGGVAPYMVFSNGDVDMKISAMQQEGTADVLASPRVTTQSGNEAVIRVVETHRYPQDYDVETGQRTAPIVKPQDWEDFDLGVVLRVTPDVDPEKGTILLQMDPEIRKFRGFEDYSVAINAFAEEILIGNNVGIDIIGDGSHLFARMPIFETRSVSTRVTVQDGHTVVMGGLLDERTETYRDQVPFLGDIPYVGRLFRTEGSRTEKKNLVICVKATQVDEHGMTRADRKLARNVSGR